MSEQSEWLAIESLDSRAKTSIESSGFKTADDVRAAMAGDIRALDNPLVRRMIEMLTPPWSALMSRVTCECALCVANLAIWNGAAASTPRYDPAASFDVESLERSFGSLSRSARREQRRPRVQRDAEPWADEIARCTEGGLRDVG